MIKITQNEDDIDCMELNTIQLHDISNRISLTLESWHSSHTLWVPIAFDRIKFEIAIENFDHLNLRRTYVRQKHKMNQMRVSDLILCEIKVDAIAVRHVPIILIFRLLNCCCWTSSLHRLRSISLFTRRTCRRSFGWLRINGTQKLIAFRSVLKCHSSTKLVRSHSQVRSENKFSASKFISVICYCHDSRLTHRFTASHPSEWQRERQWIYGFLTKICAPAILNQTVIRWAQP